MDPELDDRVAALSSQEEFQHLIHDFGATDAIVNVTNPQQAKFGSYVAATGEAIAQEFDLDTVSSIAGNVAWSKPDQPGNTTINARYPLERWALEH